MAKYTTTVGGTLDELVTYIKHNEPKLGSTITLEEEITGTADTVRYWVATFERYAILGENRVSLNVMLIEYSEGVKVIATASGGSQGAFFKINTWSEGNFLDAFVAVIKPYKAKKG
ncbi:MAG: hypothetical protein IJH90_02180 [Mogibacterium sp.]|nr:hypothetical protein [Mogibacterium sp.]